MVLYSICISTCTVHGSEPEKKSLKIEEKKIENVSKAGGGRGGERTRRCTSVVEGLEAKLASNPGLCDGSDMITYLINYSSGDTGVELSFRFSGKDGIYPSLESWLS